MRLLVITQKIDENDSVLGFMHRWVTELSRQCESVEVICLFEGQHHLPGNVRVWSLGKEGGESRLKYLKNFFSYIWNLRREYDAVLVHMNQEYVLLGGWLWRVMNKKIGLWYAHGHVPLTLRIAEKITHIILTSTQSGFRLASAKLRVIGQGIDIDYFSIGKTKGVDSVFRLIVVGRISPVKDYETLLRAVVRLRDAGLNIRVSIIGGVGLSEQQQYADELKLYVVQHKLADVVTFTGPKSNFEILEHLHASDLFVNTSLTGSLDKAMVEAMATGVPVLSCNDAMREVFSTHADNFMFEKKNDEQLAQMIEEFSKKTSTEREEIRSLMRGIVVKDHSLQSFVNKIISSYVR